MKRLIFQQRCIHKLLIVLVVSCALFQYDSLGRNKRIIEGRGTTTYYYDTEGRISDVNSPEGIIYYDYSDITGQKTKTYTTDTETEYEYDELGRLKITRVVKRNGQTVSPAEETICSYDDVGNRENMLLANDVNSTYQYDSLNRLTNVTHLDPSSQLLSSFSYTIKADGMRKSVSETLKYPGSSSETHDISYSYDNLNRLIVEDANTGLAGAGYTASYEYDLVGNRLYRTVVANGQTIETEYQYYSDGSDRLYKEIHTGPVAALPFGDGRVYAYKDSGRIIYKTDTGRDINPAKAFMFGLPNRLSLYAFFAMLLLVPVTFFTPAVAAYIKRFTRPPPEKQSENYTSVTSVSSVAKRSLWQRCLCVLLAYTMLITPLGLQQSAQAATQYNQISTADWSSGNRTIEYT